MKKLCFWDEHFGRDMVAKPFNRVTRVWCFRMVEIGNAARANPDMSQFVNRREDLRRGCVGSVHKNDRRELVADRKPAKFCGTQGTMSVPADNSGAHYQYSDRLSSAYEAPQKLLEGRALAAGIIYSQGCADAVGNFLDLAGFRESSYKPNRFRTFFNLKLAVPYLFRKDII